MSKLIVENPFAKLEDRADPSIPTATLQIYQFIHEYLERKPDTHVNRASSATLCEKRRWYQKQGEKGESLTPRKMVNFLLGDLSERTLLYFISEACVGPGKLYSEVDFGQVIGSIHFQGKEIKIYQQEDLIANLPDVPPVTAHADGFGKRNSDGQWELIEIKSASNYGFKDFKEVGAKDYLKQSMTLMMTDKCKKLGINQVRFFFLRKETGHIWDQVFDFDLELAQEVIAGYQVSNQEKEPKAPFPLIDEKNRMRITGRKVAQFPCTYCPYLATCKGKYILEWKADQFGFLKPVYVFEGKKEKI